VDCTSDFSASIVAVVVVLIFGYVNGEERMLKNFGVGDVSTPVALDRVSEAYLEDSEHGWKTGSNLKVFRMKAQCFSTSGGDDCVYHYLLGNAAAATFSVIGLWMKILDHRSRRRRRVASLPCWGHRRGAPAHLASDRCL
jgi:hypothetical protein